MTNNKFCLYLLWQFEQTETKLLESAMAISCILNNDSKWCGSYSGRTMYSDLIT